MIMNEDKEVIERFFDLLCLNGAALEKMTYEEERVILGMKMYFRGQFDRAVEILGLAAEETECDYLYTLSLTERCFAALAAGSRMVWDESSDRLRTDPRCRFENRQINELIQYSVFGVLPGYTVPGWLEEGDFSEFPSKALPYVTVLYLYHAAMQPKTDGKFTGAPLIAWIDNCGSDILGIYGNLLAAENFGRTETKEDYFRALLQNIEQKECYTPAAEYWDMFSELLKDRIKEQNEALYTKISDISLKIREGWEQIYLTDKIVNDRSCHLKLKELQIIWLICDGMSNEDIAEIMRYTLGTVKNYISDIYLKTGVRSRKELRDKRHELLPGI